MLCCHNRSSMWWWKRGLINPRANPYFLQGGFFEFIAAIAISIVTIATGCYAAYQLSPVIAFVGLIFALIGVAFGVEKKDI